MRVTYAEGCHLYKNKVEGLGEDKDRFKEAVIAAEHADVVVLCLGLDATVEGEEGDAGNEYASGDKLGLNLPGLQEELLDTITAVGKPVVLVLSAGSAIDLSWAEEHVPAILDSWYPGAHLLHGRIHGGAQLALQGLADLGRVALHHGLHGGGELLLQVGTGQQLTHGAGQQLLELLRLQVGGKTPLFKVEDAVADDIALIAIHDLLHQALQRILRDGQVHIGKQLAQIQRVHVRKLHIAHVDVAQVQIAQIQLECGRIKDGGKVKAAILQIKCTAQVELQLACIELEGILQHIGIHREQGRNVKIGFALVGIKALAVNSLKTHNCIL